VKHLLRCWAEVDMNALRGNLAWLRQRIGPKAKLLTVVKADAYGHGLKQIAALLMQSGTDIFGVANLTEARTIRAVGQGWPILMLGACLPDEIETAVRDDVRPTISSLAEARAFSSAGMRLGKPVSVHIKVDTGMGRLGAKPDEVLRLVRAIQRLPGLVLEGLYTHYAAAEDDAIFSGKQAMAFQVVCDQLASQGVRIPMVHANNSAALLHEPGTGFQLVRPGLLVYGIVPAGRRKARLDPGRHLLPALSFKCRVGFVKTIPTGTSLSYGRTFVASRQMKVATVTAGYGDGCLRAGSDRMEVLIRGRRCPGLGRITMDQMLVDVTRLRTVRAGDEVVLIGRQGRGEITVREVAEWYQTIPWEVLTAITYRVPRIYRGGQAA
jgi:alanine racemase